MNQKKNTSLTTVRSKLNAASSVLVASHANPDPDAYGSSGALGLYLREQGKHVTLINESGALEGLAFIPGVAEVVREIPAGVTWDLVVVCDCGDRKRLGETLGAQILKCAPVLNIDHHISNDFFGDYNVVLPDASSTAEIVFDLLNGYSKSLSKQVADCLYAGISGDTGSFRYSSTTSKTFRIAERLLRFGVNPFEIATSLYGKRSVASIKLQAIALSRIRFLADGKISLMLTDEAAYAASGAKKEDAEELVNLARDIEGVMVAVQIRQDGEIWRTSLRSNGQINVAEIAAEFGGGGHKAAAGFKFRSSLEELERLLGARLVDAVQALS